MAVKKLFIISRAGRAKAKELALSIESWAKGQGHCARLVEYNTAVPALDCDATTLVLVLGGDGAMISIARHVAGRCPLVGINMGRLGFLAELAIDNWQQYLAQVLLDEAGFTCKKRMLLEYSIKRQAKTLQKGLAVNDVVLSRGPLARLITLQVHCDNEEIATLRADGMVAATPTGSTAYAMSAGGPVVHPEIDAFIVTAICPFLHSLQPLVLPGSAKIIFTVQDPGADAYLTVDGQEGVKLLAGDKVAICKADIPFRLMQVNTDSFVAKLRKKRIVQ